ncbi:hypothetical protein CA85_52640 [Allorhodopirellula solitaria]|uniref:Uncharacterized protein n=1 Tax=Allorhodopirellula solitaria TaxID=2527987 RepID=A0A5C5WHJ4_9BACT|nr:hypothetical protein CA85_52640 [Allorhodopirellula solitaria]
MVVHYSVTLAWFFLHSVGQAAFNNPYIAQKDVTYQIDWCAYLWREMSGMAIFGIACAAVYGLVCYTALHADRTVPIRQPQNEAKANG